MKRALLVLLLVALVLTGCGGSKKGAATSTIPIGPVLPAAMTRQEWADRIVNIFLRPLNADLNVLTSFNNPQIQLYIASQNPTTLRIIKNRMNDLLRCSNKLVEIGPPPGSDSKLRSIDEKLHKACDNYVIVAAAVQKATPLLASGRNDVTAEGQKRLRDVRDESGRAGNNFAAAIRIAQTLPEFRRAGLKKSV
ncbi:MAG: hypothetical protein E6G50_09885 [Actinobacteria bacterium]|nr:MAG: hypothetical protein E6G50_09885 [Actinomycetota bacterium]